MYVKHVQCTCTIMYPVVHGCVGVEMLSVQCHTILTAVQLMLGVSSLHAVVCYICIFNLSAYEY